MKTLCRRGLSFLLLFALVLPLASCDSGSANSSPNWVGNWEVISIDNEKTSNPFYFDLNQDRLKIVRVFSNGCRVETGGITERSGSTIQFDFSSETWRGQFEVSNGELKVTVLSVTGEYPDRHNGEEFVAQSVENDPQDIENCSE